MSAVLDADLERRFGGLRRLYGERDYLRLRGARFAVVGLGGVGSWVVEALARSGVAGLTLIDFDQVSESNINRQIQALGSTVGMAKGQALRERIADIHPGCEVTVVDDFVTEENWPALLPAQVDGLIDACDQVRAKARLAAWAREQQLPFVTVGAAGGKQQPHLLTVEDLSTTTHDPLLASLRQRLRKHYAAPRAGRIGVACVFSREPVHMPAAGEGEACEVGDTDGSLNCHGYGSSVAVTASFGMAAAAELTKKFLQTSCER
ncbi:ThiF family adenylyltransferase [Pelomonas sp. KK5]|uniref:tRNA threonylcarbamoyladenosine dehydratase n=1 Tax=Pelomonas sp. KK5 TaxID=1855730 RepID=UPI00097C1371|nr:tRNA threonylcarbamoyladenosine dehydratase [Pelomonas sp. KK5]